MWIAARPWRAVAFACLLAAGAERAQAQAVAEPCGSLANAFGPMDYRTEKRDNLFLVESAHFTPTVEMLIKGNRGYLGADLDYTLRAFPNHHRALASVMRYGEKLKTEQLPYMNYSVECYLIRALRWRPDDTVARMLFSQYLDSKGRSAEAITQLDHVAQFGRDSALTQNNIAMLHLDAKRYDLALKHAHIAFRLGFTRPEVRDRLVAAGHWKEPDAAAQADPAASRP